MMVLRTSSVAGAFSKSEDLGDMGKMGTAFKLPGRDSEATFLGLGCV